MTPETLASSTEFFKNLPPKQCTDCGKAIDEMHESYTQQCDECQNNNF